MNDLTPSLLWGCWPIRLYRGTQRSLAARHVVQALAPSWILEQAEWLVKHRKHAACVPGVGLMAIPRLTLAAGVAIFPFSWRSPSAFRFVQDNLGGEDQRFIFIVFSQIRRRRHTTQQEPWWCWGSRDPQHRVKMTVEVTGDWMQHVAMRRLVSSHGWLWCVMCQKYLCR